MLYSKDEEQFFIQKPPRIEAYQFVAEEECVAQRRADDFGNCTFHDWAEKPYFTFEHDRHMDWVDSTISIDGEVLRGDSKAKRIDIGWWIIIDEVEDTVDFIPDYKFKARYKEDRA